MLKKPWYLFLGCLVLLHIAGFIWSVKTQAQLKDSTEYVWAAKNYAANSTFYCFDPTAPIDYRGFSKRPPLYPLLILLTQKRWILLVFQNLLSIFTIVFTSRLFIPALFNNPDTKSCLLACLLWLLSPSQIIYSNLVMADIWLQFTVVGAFYGAWKCFNDLSLKNTLLLAVFVTAGLLLKPVVVPMGWLLPFLIAGLGFYKKSPIKIWILLTVIACIPLLSLLGISAWHRQTTGLFHYSSISDINLLHYNTRYTLIAAKGSAEKADSVLQPFMLADSSRDTYRQNTLNTRKNCRELLKNNWQTYLTIHIKGMLRFAVDPGRFDLLNFSGNYTETGNVQMEKAMHGFSIKKYMNSVSPFFAVLLLLVLITNGLKLLLAAMLFQSKPHRVLMVLLLLIALYLAGLTGPLGASRFVLPLLPLINAAAVAGYINRFKSPRG